MVSLATVCLSLFLVATTGSASAQETPAHPLTGRWTWTLPGKKCVETLIYRPDATRSGTSGEEVTEAAFQVTPVPSLLGFYRMTETVTRVNGKRDCSGDLNIADAEPMVRFIQLNPQKDFLIMCKTESLQACYGPMQRMPQKP